MRTKKVVRVTRKKRPTTVPRIIKRTTAYALLNKVCALILEEPRRYYQGAWIKLLHEDDRVVGNPEHLAPACGTVACVAGWVRTLVSNKDAALNAARETVFTGGPLSGREQFRIAVDAQRILGITESQADVLFSGRAIESSSAVHGTREYALAGVAHIRAFQEAHAAKLKRTVVNPATWRRK